MISLHQLSLSMSQSDAPNAHPGLGNVQGNIMSDFSRHVISQMCFWLGVRRRWNNQQPENFYKLGLLRRILLTASLDMLKALAIWFIFNHLISITMWWTQSLFSSQATFSGCSGSAGQGLNSRLFPARF